MIEVARKKIPENWIWSTFGNVAELLRGVNYKKPDASSEPAPGKLPVLRANNIGYGLNFEGLVYVPEKLIKKEQVIKAGDIIIAMSSGSKHLVGKAAQATQDFKGSFGAFCANLRVTADIEPKYVAYYYSSQVNLKRISASSSGSNINNLKRENILDSPVPLAPPEQQKRIVAKIEELFSHIDAGIEALKKAKQLLKQYRQSVLKAAVTGELTKEWREANKGKLEPASKLLKRILKERRQKWEQQQLKQFKAKGKLPKDDKWKEKYKEPRPADAENLQEIPDEWVWVTLPQLGELNRGKSKHRPRNDPGLYGGEYPFVQTGDVRAANTWLKEYKQTYSEKGLAQSRLWPKGTMCITIAANIADTAILGFDACFPDSMVGFISLNDSVNVEVIEFFIRTVKDDLEKYAPATAQKNINIAILETVSIPLLPMREQDELINSLAYKMSISDRLEEEIMLQLTKAEKNKQSILASAFKGALNENK